MATGYTGDLRLLLHPPSAISTVKMSILVKSLKRVGGKVESSFFILCTQAFYGGRLSHPQGSDWPHAVVASRLLLGGRKIRSPAIDPSSRHSGPRSPSPRPVETPAHPGLRARPRAVPSGRWPSVLAQTRRLRPQKPRRPSLGLQVAAIPSAMHARCHPETSPKAWLGLLRGLDPGEQGADGIVEAARTGRRHPGATLAGKESLQNRRVARLVAAARAKVRSVRRTGTEAHPGPPAHPAQAEAVGGPGGRRPHYLARCALCRN